MVRENYHGLSFQKYCVFLDIIASHFSCFPMKIEKSDQFVTSIKIELDAVSKKYFGIRIRIGSKTWFLNNFSKILCFGRVIVFQSFVCD